MSTESCTWCRSYFESEDGRIICNACKSVFEKKPETWYAERNESGDYDITDYPGYCTDEVRDLPDEAELVQRSELDKAIDLLKKLHNQSVDTNNLLDACQILVDDVDFFKAGVKVTGLTAWQRFMQAFTKMRPQDE